MEPETIEDSINRSQTRLSSHLFTIRVWAEELGDGQWEWRGRVQHVLTGETNYFRDWDTCLNHLRAMLTEPTLSDEAGSIGIE